MHSVTVSSEITLHKRIHKIHNSEILIPFCFYFSFQNSRVYSGAVVTAIYIQHFSIHHNFKICRFYLYSHRQINRQIRYYVVSMNNEMKSKLPSCMCPYTQYLGITLFWIVFKRSTQPTRALHKSLNRQILLSLFGTSSPYPAKQPKCLTNKEAFRNWQFTSILISFNG